MKNYTNKTALRSAFEANADPSFFYESKHHSEAIARLLYVSNDYGINIGVVSGKIGSGKTLWIPKSFQPFEIQYVTKIQHITSVSITCHLKLIMYYSLPHTTYTYILNIK